MEEFLQTEYARRILGLLHSSKLKVLTQKYNCELVFAAHPMFKRWASCFSIPSDISIFDSQKESFQECFANSSLMITDYSLVAFDFAMLGRTVIYYQFDFDDVFNKAKHFYQQGYFDFQRDGFGPVVYDEEALLKTIEQSIANNFVTESKYAERIEHTFGLRDGQNSARTYEAIKNILSQA